mmetsp:Transcript_85/g.339  ORF Transcript_85/g.339 Transcript_85/m.339 type:complete len:470 (+) Transcript_85:111-1520(+)
MLRFPMHLRASRAAGALHAVERLPSLCTLTSKRALSTLATSSELSDAPPPGLFSSGAGQVPAEPTIAADASGAGAGAGDARPSFASKERQLRELAAQQPTAVSLGNLFRSGLDPTPEQSLLNAQFLWRELRIRVAHRITQLRALPAGLNEHPCVVEAASMYEHMSDMLGQCKRPGTYEDEERFAQVLANTKPTAAVIPRKIGIALAEVRRRTPLSPEQQRQVDVQLDAFFLNRVGHRLLIQHYLASKQPREGFSGIIQSKCSPVAVCEDAAKRVTTVIRERCGACPEIKIIGDRGHTFTYIPSHIYFIANELLKNACAATVRRHRGTGELPAVRVIVARGEEDMTIKVEDEGGGIARSRLSEVWSYAGEWSDEELDFNSSLISSPAVGGEAAPLAQKGLGLPLARLYAKYFGGTLHVTPMEGYGTDCYVRLYRLGDQNCENLPSLVRQSPGELDSTAKGSLFDAQAKRM